MRISCAEEIFRNAVVEGQFYEFPSLSRRARKKEALKHLFSLAALVFAHIYVYINICAFIFADGDCGEN